MKKKLFFVFLFLFILNLCKIDVYASSYVDCYYNYVPTDPDFCYLNGWISCKSQAGLVLVIQYNSDKITTPKFYAKAYDREKFNFNNINSSAEFVSLYNKINKLNEDNSRIDCTNRASFHKLCFRELPTINVSQLKNNEDKLVCPNIYLFKEDHDNFESVWAISLYSDGRLTGGNFDSTGIISPFNFSVVYNDDTESSNTKSNKKIVTTCQYKYENFRQTAFISGSGRFGFSILEDGTVDDIVANTGIIESNDLKFEGNKIDDLKCPNYLKFSYNPITQKTKFSVTNSESEADAFYEGTISNADDNVITRYLHLNNSSKYIDVKKSGNNYVALFYSQNITIENMDTFLNSQSSTMPTYIIEVVENGSVKYKFANEVSSEKNQNIYMEKSKIYDLSSLSTSEIIYSCRDLFGDSFIEFLKKNVYIPFVIAIPILLIVLTTIDFAKVVFIDDKEGIKKAGAKFGKRVMMAVIILLVPTILIFVADTIGVDDVQQCAKLIKGYGEEKSN